MWSSYLDSESRTKFGVIKCILLQNPQTNTTADYEELDGHDDTVDTFIHVKMNYLPTSE